MFPPQRNRVDNLESRTYKLGSLGAIGNGMIKTLTSLLILAALLIHAVLGCCAHHAHGTDIGRNRCVHADSGSVHTHSDNARMCASCPDSGTGSPCNASNSSDGQPDGHDKDGHVPCDDVPCEWLGLSSTVWSTHLSCFSLLRAYDCGPTVVATDFLQTCRIDAALSERPNRVDVCALTQVYLL